MPISDLNNILGDKPQNNIPQDSLLFRTNSKKKVRKSIFDIEQENLGTQIPAYASNIPNQIVIPQSIAEMEKQQIIDTKSSIDKRAQLLKIQNYRAKSYKTLPEKVDASQEQIEEVKQNLEELTNQVLPDDVNYVELEEQIQDAIENIPGINDENYLDDLVIKSTSQKDKSGYFKTVVGIKGDFPQQILKIAGYVKKNTKGLISPRKCDLRVIGNTNKTQLRNSQLKLSSQTIVFKPDFTKLKVNKGTRIMISIPEDNTSTGNLLVYIQESRAKKCLLLTPKDFPSIEHFNEFIGDRITEYYFSGYDVVIKKLEIRGVNNPLMEIINLVVRTREYKAKPYTDEDSHLYAIDFISLGTENQWLRMQVIEGDIPGTYNIIAKNNVIADWEYSIMSKPLTITDLTKNILSILNKCYAKDWTKELAIDNEDDKIYYNLDKLTHSRLKKAYMFINNMKDENPELGIVLATSLSKKDLSKSLSLDYDAEAFIGKTVATKFVLSYLAVQVIGGDKRHGKDYITTQEYYEKYNVKDKRDYQDRQKTILKKEGNDRNYNSRIYMFQLEYFINDVKVIYKNTNWDQLLEDTGFLTESPKVATSKY